jgi:hypothetical protein
VRCRFPVIALLLALAGARAAAAENGIASRYPGDLRIGRDSRVLLFEDFESGAVRDLSTRWSDVKNAEGMSFVADVPAASPGKRALEITSQAGVNTGGHLYTALPSGQKRVHLRYYVQYASVGTYHHSGGWLGGYHPKSAFPQGGSGERSRRGAKNASRWLRTRRFGSALDFTYWMGMRPMAAELLGQPPFGNPACVRPDQWTCIEILLKVNDPVSTANGELAVG